MLNKDDSIYVAGHLGMVGSAIMRRLQAEGYRRIVTRTHSELDLIDQRAVTEFFSREKIDVVFMAAAKVGGIHANDTYRADFIYENLMVECNVIHAAFKHGVERLLFLGSSCIYPRICPQPMREEYLLSGYLEPTNEPYAVSKIAGIKLCESYNRQHGTRYRSVMPTNLYGRNDNFDLENSHVLPAMIRKYHLAKLALNQKRGAIADDEKTHGPIPADIKAALGLDPMPSEPLVRLWGTGTPRREFLHVDDMAAACLFVMQLSDDQYENACRGEGGKEGSPPVSHLNAGFGEDISIRDLAVLIGGIVGFGGKTVWDAAKPDGMPRKMLDSSRLTRLGWTPQIGLEHGIRLTYDAYLHPF